jgi:hypothetical protein
MQKSAYSVGETVLFNDKKYTILSKRRGGKTNKVDYQNGIVPNGIKSKPCTYQIDTNLFVRGDKLKKVKTT